MTYCNHITRVKEWGFDEAHNFKVTKYDCLLCELTSPVPFKDEEDIAIDHTGCDDNCFACKVRTLELNTGDANSQKTMSNKKWHSELDAYRAARSEGIQPAGTSMKQIQEARRASDVMGKAFDANTMGSTEIIQNKTVSKLKEVGVI
jgi:hypothetical protein